MNTAKIDEDRAFNGPTYAKQAWSSSQTGLGRVQRPRKTVKIAKLLSIVELGGQQTRDERGEPRRVRRSPRDVLTPALAPLSPKRELKTHHPGGRL